MACMTERIADLPGQSTKSDIEDETEKQDFTPIILTPRRRRSYEEMNERNGRFHQKKISQSQPQLNIHKTPINQNNSVQRHHVQICKQESFSECKTEVTNH